jgi:hypothetical protein
MVDPKLVDFNQVPKKFCDGAIGAVNKEIFFFALTSGNTIDAFATSPQIMKSIQMWMSKQVEDYEKRFGVINMDQESPIKVTDVKGSAE